MNYKISRRTRRSRFPSLVDDHQTPRTLPTTANDFHVKLVLRIRLQVVEHHVQVGGVSVRVTLFVDRLRFRLSVSHDVVTIVRD